jgi:hypothetical protein
VPIVTGVRLDQAQTVQVQPSAAQAERTTARERNARRIVQIMVKHFPSGVTTEDFRRQCEDEGIKKTVFYEALNCTEEHGWIVGGGEQNVPYNLNPDGCWKEILETTPEKTAPPGPYKGGRSGVEYSVRSGSGVVRSGGQLKVVRKTPQPDRPKSRVKSMKLKVPFLPVEMGRTRSLACLLRPAQPFNMSTRTRRSKLDVL